MRSLSVTLGALVAANLVFAITPTASAASIPAQVIGLTNAERARHHCPALIVDARLTRAAQGHSQDMAARRYFSHTSRDGRSPAARISATGYRYSRWAENIAWGYATPAAVVAAWMKSAGHRANILNCALRQIGVGYAKSGTGTPYWTQDFGAPR